MFLKEGAHTHLIYPHHFTSQSLKKLSTISYQYDFILFILEKQTQLNAPLLKRCAGIS